jgi:hypothetical protein
MKLISAKRESMMRGGGGLLHVGVSLGGGASLADHPLDVGLERGVRGGSDGGQRGELEGLVGAVQIDLRQRQLHAGLDLRDLFFGGGGANQGRQVVVATLGQVFGGGQPHFGIGKTELERGERGLELASQAVVEARRGELTRGLGRATEDR